MALVPREFHKTTNTRKHVWDQTKWSEHFSILFKMDAPVSSVERNFASLRRICRCWTRNDWRRNVRETGELEHEEFGGWYMDVFSDNGIMDGNLDASYTVCPRRNVPDFGRVFLMLKYVYTDITQNTYIQSWTVTEIMAREVWNFDSCYTLIDYQIHIKTGRIMLFL